jgi:hypothetical protein
MVQDRGPAVVSFAALGVACVLAGGLVAAATTPAPSQHGSWAAADLMLVAGVAQVALGVGQALLALQAPSSRLVAAEFVGWSVGNAAVVAGALLDTTTVVDVGAALLIVALVLVVHRARGAPGRRSWPLYAFRLLMVLLLVSIPVGLVLAQLQSV